MTQRFLAGLHPGFGTMGIWLSKPGIDVAAAGPPSNFLLRSDIRNEQIVASGAVAMAPGQTILVPLPANLIQRPYVMLHGNLTGDLEYPCNVNAAAPGGADGTEVFFSCQIISTTLRFFNPMPSNTQVGFYMVFSRSIGV